MTGAQHDHFPPETPTAWQRLTPDEKTAHVRQAVEANGLTFSQAARALGAPSAGAIAGVVKRAQKTAQPIVSTSGQGNDDKRRSKPKHAGFHKFVALPFVASIIAEPAPDAVWLPLEGSHPVAIGDHHEGQCRWTIGADRPFAYCGEPVKSAGVYCSRHAAVAYRELPTKTARKETA